MSEKPKDMQVYVLRDAKGCYALVPRLSRSIFSCVEPIGHDNRHIEHPPKLPEYPRRSLGSHQRCTQGAPKIGSRQN